MLDATVDQENFAIQGLLALRDCDSTNESNKSTSPQSFVTTPELNEISEITSASKVPSDSSIEYAATESKTVTNTAPFKMHSQQSQTQQAYHFQQKQQEYRDRQAYNAQQAFNAQQIRHAHQYQVVQPSNSSSTIRLPSIKEMLAQHPLLHRSGQTIPIYENKEIYAKDHLQRYSNIQSEKTDRQNTLTEFNKQYKTHCHCDKKRQILEAHTKNQQKLQNSQTLDFKALLQSHNIHKCLEKIKSLSDFELQAFLSGLRQYYRDEYDRELKSQNKKCDTSDAIEPRNNDTDETDNDDDGSEYKLSSDNSHGSDSNTVFINNNNKRTKVENTKSCRGSIEKPRWTTEEKLELLDAVIKHKSLDIMATFDWNVIGADAGRTDKACKDQWRRGILKLFRDYVSRL
ncbi:hypothetical protein INT47_000429 [Mucor saturninus]|uniref:Myb-like domain-containing protein n=1 Tax=Mucor saturninus TaxID=64648 RepID=A0A8H7QMM7_9FUNG|nr:hypothetical protein INT47_000429 [Mucor saturninus]